jgi:hypothetical protein
MTMRGFRIKSAIIEQVTFESVSLGLLGNIIHPLTRDGVFYGLAFHEGAPTAAFRLTASQLTKSGQVHVDLARLACLPSPSEGISALPSFGVATGGAVLFHTSRGSSGYWVHLYDPSSMDKPAFDSRALHSGDIYAVTMIKPGTYTATMPPSSASLRITVSVPSREQFLLNLQQPAVVDCLEGSFKPDQLALSPGQGIVFRIQAPLSVRIARDGLPLPARKPARLTLRDLSPRRPR